MAQPKLDLFELYRPSNRRSPLGLAAKELAGLPSNAQAGIKSRVLSSRDELNEALTFLAGFIIAVRQTKTKRHKQFHYEADDIMERGHKLFIHALSPLRKWGAPGLPRLKKMRKLQDEIIRFVRKVEAELKAS